MGFTLRELAARVGGEVIGDAAVVVDGIAPLEEAGPGQASFYANKKYKKAFETTRAAFVIVEPGTAAAPGRNLLAVRNAYLAFAKISTLFHPPREPVPEIAPSAVIHATARVHPSAQVMPLACVGPDAEVGERTIVFPGAHVGHGAKVGADCLVYHNVTIRDRCVVGDRVILQPGAVIGSDGFGFAFDPEGEGKGPRHYKVPQAGIVVIEDDVEIGANTCIDRGTLGATRIGRGAKLDNLVQIAHNVEVGPLSLLAAQTGIAGSTKLGMGVATGGQVGITGHIRVGDGVRFGAQTGVIGDVEAGEVHSGYPNEPHTQWLRNTAAFQRLDEMRKELRRLQKEVERLSAGTDRKEQE